jgi:hypothetical protein
MFVNQSWLKPALSVLTIMGLGSLYFNLYNEHQFVATCQAQLGQLHLIETQSAQTEIQLDAAEARLDAAETQLDRAK